MTKKDKQEIRKIIKGLPICSHKTEKVKQTLYENTAIANGIKIGLKLECGVFLTVVQQYMLIEDYCIINNCKPEDCPSLDELYNISILYK